jgi:HK97 gp10 family phage protein
VITTKWTGIEEAKRSIRSLGEAFSQPVEEAALKKVGAPIRDDIAQNVPKASGLTAEDIRMVVSKVGRAEGRTEILIGARTGKGGRAFVLRFLERGTAHMAAQPTVRPAYDRAAPSLLRDIASELGIAYDRFVKKFAAKARAA